MSTAEVILFAFGGPTVLVALLAWLGKTLLDKLIARDALTFSRALEATYQQKADELRAGLQLEAARETEKLKAALNLHAMEHQVRYLRLHEKRAEVIAALYALMVEAFWEAESFLSPISWNGEPSKPEKFAIANNKLVEFFRYLERHRIYLPDDVGRKAQQLAMDVRTHVINLSVFLHWDDDALNEGTRKQKIEAMRSGYAALKEQVPAIRKQIEDDFRLLLGDEAIPALKAA